MKDLGLIDYSLRSLYKCIGITEQAVSQHAKRAALNMQRILRINQLVLEYRKDHPGCGVYKMHDQLKPAGVGRDRFVEILKQLGFVAVKQTNYTRTTIPGHIKFPNLIQGMLVHRINHVWQTDITYFKVDRKFYYLIFIADVYSRKIVGHKVSDSMHAAHNLRCLKKAISARKITKHTNLIHHSDLGSQFTSIGYLLTLKKYNIQYSMGQKGQDNAYCERINGTIKNEYLVYRKINSFSSLVRWTQQAVKHYNSARIHSALPDKSSPDLFEEKLLTLKYQERPKVIIYADGNKTVREDYVFLDSLTKKDRQDHNCPITVNY